MRHKEIVLQRRSLDMMSHTFISTGFISHVTEDADWTSYNLIGLKLFRLELFQMDLRELRFGISLTESLKCAKHLNDRL